MATVPVFCGKDCGGNACPLLAVVEDGRVTRIIQNPAGGKFLKGCSRGFYLVQEQYASDRILNPLIRTGERGSGQFREASWDEALNLTAERLGEIRARYGATAILNRSSAGVTGALHVTYLLLSRFLNLLGGSSVCTSNYSVGAGQFILPYLLGDGAQAPGFDAATMQYSEMIVLWGANVLETRQGAEVPLRLIEAKKRGAQIVVIDPRRSATVKQAATWWIPCRPGMDAALMLAVLQVLCSEGLVERAFVQSHSAGFDALERSVLGLDGSEARTPEWAEGVCGVAADEIRRFARAYAAAKPAMLFPGYSIQRVFAGEETYRLTVALQIATGNFGKRGGSTGAINSFLPTPRVGSLPVPAAPEQAEIPVLRWPDAVLQGRSGGYPADIHALYGLGANFINQGGDIRKNIAAMKKMDFAVCHELFMTPSARYCDVVFPSAGPLEKEDIGLPWLGNYLLYKQQVVAPLGQARSDYDALWDLAERMGFGAAFSEGRTAAQWISRFIAESEIPDEAEFRRTGVYFAPDQERVGLEAFGADPQMHPLSTPSGKVEIFSEAYRRETGGSPIPTWQAAPVDERYPLLLITPKSPHRTHSQGSNLPVAQKKAQHTLQMHPADASARRIADGDGVALFNAQGATRVTVELTEDLTRGVVCLPEGKWVDLDATGVDQAGAANMLTSTQGTAANQDAIMHAVSVEVQRLAPEVEETIRSFPA
jgi:anaerobic dimethyl sulfoxide reductase subunit A